MVEEENWKIHSRYVSLILIHLNFKKDEPLTWRKLHMAPAPPPKNTYTHVHVLMTSI